MKWSEFEKIHKFVTKRRASGVWHPIFLKVTISHPIFLHARIKFQGFLHKGAFKYYYVSTFSIFWPSLRQNFQQGPSVESN